MTSRENYLRSVRFERPEVIPMSFHINSACWHHYDQTALQDLMESHPLLFPGFVRQNRVEPRYGLNQRADAPYTDPWGCEWCTTDNGITGSVHGHPLEDWENFHDYRAPDPGLTDGTFPLDWEALRSDVEGRRSRGDLVVGGLPHGHTFLRLQDIRGYENLLIDMVEKDPRVETLVSMVETFNTGYVARWLDLNPDVMAYPEDLGMQIGPMISPEMFRRYIKPVYTRLMKPVRDRGLIVHMHSDGDIRTLADDLIEGGIDVINLQDLVNGIDWIAEHFAGRTCIELDIDRQAVTARGTPADIDSLIRDEVALLGSAEGGFMMVYGLYPGVPLENAKALMDAMERYAGFFS